MMDISQLNRPQNDSFSVNSTRRADSSSQSGENNAFGQHLNNSMEKAESANTVDKAEKNVIKQEARNEAPVNKAADSEPDAGSEVKQQVAEADESAVALEVDESALLEIKIGSEVINTESPVIEENTENQQILPLDGSDLPLSEDELLLSDDQAQVPAAVVNAAAEVTKISKVATQVDAGVSVEDRSQLKQGVDNPQSAPANQLQKAVAAFNVAENGTVDPDLTAQKARMVVKSDDIRPVINAESKASSASSIVTAAASLQQVPGLTSASASHLAPATSFTDPAMSATPSLFKASIPVPLQSPNWSQGVSERVAWMVQGNFQNAEIKLNPAHLGPLEIKMSINDDQASITFVSAHAPVREALDQALPRLREMFEQQGLQLVDVDVSQYSESQNDETGEFQADSSSQINEDSAEQTTEGLQQGVISVDSNSGVNIYA